MHETENNTHDCPICLDKVTDPLAVYTYVNNELNPIIYDAPCILQWLEVKRDTQAVLLDTTNNMPMMDLTLASEIRTQNNWGDGAQYTNRINALIIYQEQRLLQNIQRVQPVVPPVEVVPVHENSRQNYGRLGYYFVGNVVVVSCLLLASIFTINLFKYALHLVYKSLMNFGFSSPSVMHPISLVIIIFATIGTGVLMGEIDYRLARSQAVRNMFNPFYRRLLGQRDLIEPLLLPLDDIQLALNAV